MKDIPGYLWFLVREGAALTRHIAVGAWLAVWDALYFNTCPDCHRNGCHYCTFYRGMVVGVVMLLALLLVAYFIKQL